MTTTPVPTETSTGSAACLETPSLTPCMTCRPVFTDDEVVRAHELVLPGSPSRLFEEVAAAAENPDPEDGGSAGPLARAHQLLPDGLPTFVPIDHASLLAPGHRCLSARETTFMLGVDVERAPEVESGLAELRQAGYGLLADDLTGVDDWRLGYATHARVNFLRAGEEQRQACATVKRERGIQTVAADVETRDEFVSAFDHEFDYVQGAFFLRPRIVDFTEIPEFKANHLRFIQAVNKPETDFSEIEDLIQADVSLSLKLLKFLNSAAFAWRREVTSIRQALVILGEQPLRRWAAMMAVTQLGSDQPSSLALLGLTRARCCEALATHAGLPNEKLSLFFTGLLSGLDALVGRPIHELLDEIAVPIPVRDALLGESSVLRDTLDCVVAYEFADWPAVQRGSEALGVDPETLADEYVGAISWARQIMTL